MAKKRLSIRENKDGIFVNGVAQKNVVDVQVKRNLHQKVEVQITYLADEFLKEDFSNGLTDRTDC
ncbi:hypothetical protein [Levilactobacillus angrenensis]|uniref:Uncharacterized protein n=1 Tax=Levilactobacillus angrenensis TaxID=2486020 RepID=A0ABW1UBE3_9LACO|nr:hypothetical protein [Levilactobacillus angrenensis]